MKAISIELERATARQYKLGLKVIGAANIPFLIGGGVAMDFYTGYRTKFNDLDIFCKAGDYPKALEVLAAKGFKTKVQDEKWIAKASKGKAKVDLLFSTANGVQVVDDSWMSNGRPAEIFNVPVKILGPEELLWCKIYAQHSRRFDGPDINHLILKVGDKMDWQLISARMGTHWEILLAALLIFRFVYPSERNKIPTDLMDQLVSQLQAQLKAPLPKDRVCRGPLLSREDYLVDVIQEGFIF